MNFSQVAKYYLAFMKKFLVPLVAVALMLSSCGHKNDTEGKFPANFATIGDAGRMDYMMKRVKPDSLARFVIDGALGRIEGMKIDTLAIATVYIYDHLQGDDLDTFSMEFDSYAESLPLEEKMKIYSLGGSDDPQKLGYKLGLEYLGAIREHNKTADEVEKELRSFKKACGKDTAMYRRFIIGFHTVLAVDSGKDLSPEIYRRFINYE